VIFPLENTFTTTKLGFSGGFSAFSVRHGEPVKKGKRLKKWVVKAAISKKMKELEF
jgi:hypothetical protein